MWSKSYLFFLDHFDRGVIVSDPTTVAKMEDVSEVVAFSRFLSVMVNNCNEYRNNEMKTTKRVFIQSQGKRP